MDVVQVQPYFAFAWWANALSDEFMVLCKDLEFIQRHLFNLDVIILFWVDELLTLIASLIHFSCTFAASPIDKVTHLEHTIWVRMVGLIDSGNMYLACGTEIQALWPNALAIGPRARVSPLGLPDPQNPPGFFTYEIHT